MSDAKTNPPMEVRVKGRRRKLLLKVFGVLVLFGAATLWYVHTLQFQNWLHWKIVRTLEQATGGKVELGEFHTIPLQMRVEMRNLIIHGSEKPGEPPLAQIAKVEAQLRLKIAFAQTIGLESLKLEQPAIHVVVNPDGSTNIPAVGPPSVGESQSGAQQSVDQLLSIFISRLEVQHGSLWWNQEKIPLDIKASDVDASIIHALFRSRLDGKIHVGKVETAVVGYRPFSWSGDLEFGLTRKRLDVKSLQVFSGRSRGSFAGAVSDFTHPKIDARYDASVRLDEVASILREKELSGGTVELKGDGKWSQQEFSAAGKVLAREIELRTGSSVARNLAGNAQFKLDNQRLRLSELQGKAFGGAFAGDLDVANWRSLQPAKGKTAAPQSGTIRLKLKDLSLGELANVFSSAEFPVDRLRPAGSVSGTTESKWSQSLTRADTSLALDITALDQKKGGLPVSGKVAAVYRGSARLLEVEQMNLTSQATHLEATGTLGSPTATLKVNVSSTSLGEWQPILSAFRGTARLPFHLLGQGSFTGVLSGGLLEPRVLGQVHLTNFDTAFLHPAPGVPQTLHWDSLQAEVEASPRILAVRNGVVRRNGMAATFDADAALANGALLESSPVHASLSLSDADVAEVLSVAGASYPISGKLNLNLEMAGTKAAPAGDGDLQIQQATIYGEPIQKLTSRIRIHANEIEFYDLLAEYAQGEVSGTAKYDLRSHQLQSDLKGKGFDLAQLPGIRDNNKFGVGGRGSFSARVAGSVEHPSIDARLDAEDLLFESEHEGAAHLEAATHGDELHISGGTKLEHAEMQLDGTIQMHSPYPAQMHVHLAQADIDPVLRTYLKGRLTGHSAVEGDIQMQGPLSSPNQWSVQADLSRLAVELDNVKVANDGPIRFSVIDGSLNLERLHLAGDQTNFTASGLVQLNQERQLDLSANGNFNLSLLQNFSQEILATGSAKVSARITGTLSKPLLQGRMDVEHGGVAFVNLPNALSDINGTVLLNRDRLEIENLTAKSGGGQLNIKGYLNYGRYVEFNFTAQGQDVRLRYPPGMSSTTNADLRFFGTSAGATLAGDLLVTKFGVSQGFNFASMASSNGIGGIPIPPESPLNRVKFDVHIVSTPDLRMNNNLIRVSGEADLRLRGTAAKPILLGRVNVQEGDIYFNGSKYRLERGDIILANPVKMNPAFDLSATTRVRDYDIEIRFTGTASELKTTYRSEPPLPESDIIALLALGRTQEESARLNGSQSAFTQEASNAILGQAINATVSSRVQKLFGVSRIKIDPQAPGTETSTSRGPQVTIEQQVSNQLTVTYIQDVAQATQQTIQGEYNVTRNISLVAVRDQNGVFAFDIRIRQRKK